MRHPSYRFEHNKDCDSRKARRMLDAYEEGVDLETRLEFAVEEFERERNEHWSDDSGEESDFLYLVRGMGNYYLRAAEFLVNPTPNEDLPATDWTGIRDLAENPLFDQYVNEHVQMSVAKEFALGTEQKTRRCRELAALLVENPPGPKVIGSIQRVTRSYIAGFYAECLILCRAVVDTAVRDAFDRKGMPLPEDSDTTMRERVETLVERFRCLSPEQGRSARDIWRQGSDVAHARRDWREIDRERALELIGATVAVLRDLYDRG